MRQPLLLSLLALAVALAATAAFEVEFSSEPPAPERQALAFAAPRTASGAGVTDTDREAALEATILARPLFATSRRPPEHPANGVADARPSLPRLAGIVVGPAGRAAIFAGQSGGRPVVSMEGDKVGDYVIRSIDVDMVVVVGREGSHTLRPAFDPNAPPVTRTAMVPSAERPAAFPPMPNSPGRTTLPGLTGPPLGLAAVPADAAAEDRPDFSSIAGIRPTVAPNAARARRTP